MKISGAKCQGEYSLEFPDTDRRQKCVKWIALGDRCRLSNKVGERVLKCRMQMTVLYTEAITTIIPY